MREHPWRERSRRHRLSRVVSYRCIIFLFSLPSDLISSIFFFLMIRRPPRSTLFPTRRSSDLKSRRLSWWVWWFRTGRPELGGKRTATRVECKRQRSEEHTSELQSPVHLVCRLLLEKKKHT